jgi:hypothetical protein
MYICVAQFGRYLHVLLSRNYVQVHVRPAPTLFFLWIKDFIVKVKIKIFTLTFTKILN